MHILLILFGALGFIWIWYLRLKALRTMIRDGQKMAKSMSDWRHRMKQARLSSPRGRQSVSDPREAATALMLEIARARGTFNTRQAAAVRAEIMQHFDFDEAAADNLIGHTRRLIGDDMPAERVILKMTDFVQKCPTLGPEQIVDLDGMLVAITEAEGSPSRAQMDLLTLYRETTGLKV